MSTNTPNENAEALGSWLVAETNQGWVLFTASSGAKVLVCQGAAAAEVTKWANSPLAQGNRP